MSASKAAKTTVKALRQSNNEWSNKYFAIAVGSIIALFTVYKWSSEIYFRWGPRVNNPVLDRGYRKTRAFLSSSLFGSRIDRLLLYTVYWAINLILALTNVDLTEVSYVAKRLGWISVANLVLLVFLALKNTPIAPLAATSYEKLRPLHKLAGYTCIFTTVLHGIVYLSAWAETGKLAEMQQRKNYSGAIAGISMVIIGCSTITYLMRRYYEVFYTLHITMFILIIITVGMHRPKVSSSTIIITGFIACLWALDRLARGFKCIWYFFGNSAIITALPNNAIRVRLSRGMNASPGSHVFLWLPAIRWLETHPFTLVSSNPPEFAIKVYDGFTRALYRHAQERPGVPLRCSVDGAYGQVPNFQLFEKVILVAGGSGASFTFSIALDLIRSSIKTVKSIHFIWVVRYDESLEWFQEELKQLQSHQMVEVLVYVTSHIEPSRISEWMKVSDEDVTSATAASPASPVPITEDIEKTIMQMPKATLPSSINEVHPGRPNIDSLIKSATVSSGPCDDRTIVGACGPRGLMDTVRKTVHNDMRSNGPPMSLYTEEFEW